jgi:hypothetical protein
MMNSSDMPLTKDTWRSWISTRAQELKQDTPSRSKKDCWRTAQAEWLELRRQLKRKEKPEKHGISRYRRAF